MPSAYGSTGFTLNNPGDPSNWGAVERTAFQNVIDTLVIGTCKAAKDTAVGHQHYRMFRPAGDFAALTIDANYDATLVGHLFLADDKEARFGNTLAEPDAKIFWDNDAGRNSGGALVIQSNNVSRDLYIKTQQSGSVILETGEAGYVAMSARVNSMANMPNNTVGFSISNGNAVLWYRNNDGNFSSGTITLA